ncbi:hypothetical protein JHK84_055185 [Glycine max]|nr:hypothetical protein JHK84_055185 [Glycine max]
MEDFQHMVHQCGLVDLGFLGRQFTWSRGTLSERLDRAFASTSWRTQFPKNCMEHRFSKPIKLSRRGANISHLMFADDLILFSEAFVDHVEVISAFLDFFCESSVEKGPTFNADGAMGREAACGGVIRNHDEKFFLAFHTGLGRKLVQVESIFDILIPGLPGGEKCSMSRDHDEGVSWGNESSSSTGMMPEILRVILDTSHQFDYNKDYEVEDDCEWNSMLGGIETSNVDLEGESEHISIFCSDESVDIDFEDVPSKMFSCREIEPDNMATTAKNVVVIQDASKTLNLRVFYWIINGLSLKPEDVVTLVAILHEVYHPMGYRITVDNKLLGVNQRIIEQELANKKQDYLMDEGLAQIVKHYASNKVAFKIKLFPGSSPKDVALEQATKLNATWVILDRQMKKDKEFFLEKLSCGISILRHNNRIVRLRPIDLPDEIPCNGHETYDESLPSVPYKDLFNVDVFPKSEYRNII